MSGIVWVLFLIGIVVFVRTTIRAYSLDIILLALLPILIGRPIEQWLETQIRHLNNLALSPFEYVRMDMAGVKRVWLGGAVIVVAWVFSLICFVVLGDATPAMVVGIPCVAATITGIAIMSYRTGLSWLQQPRFVTYDPDDDEFKWGWWW